MDTTNQNLKTLSDADADIMLENLTSKAIKTLSTEDSLLYEYFIASPYMADFDDLNSNEHKIFLGSYSDFPLSLKTFIAASQTANVIYSIGKEYNLNDSKISQLGSSVRELVTGKLFIKDFPSALSSKFGIDDVKAGEIANKIISKSFGPIIEDVKRIQRSKFPDKIAQLQKETQPTGLTQPMARPDSPQAARPDVAKTPPQEPKLPPISSSSQQMRPPPQVPTKPQSVPPLSPPAQQMEQSRPLDSIQNKSMPPKPGSRTSDGGFAAPKQFSEVSLPGKPEPVPAMPKPQFKIPDFSGMGSAPQSKPSDNTIKSLEEELEKVASVIDLRTNPKE